MYLTKRLISTIFSASYMHRWNDKLRPTPLLEIDKQSHKMMIAFFLGKYEERNGTAGFSWERVIRGGFFDFLTRTVTTDLKPSIFYHIKKNSLDYEKFNEWIYNELKPQIEHFGEDYLKEYKDHLFSKGAYRDLDINRKILEASHFYASLWESSIIIDNNPNSYDIDDIKRQYTNDIENFYDLEGIREIVLYSKYKNFINLCGELRYQLRWSNRHKIPQTSVLGHSLLVAFFCYLLTLELSPCEKRIYNNFFTGLFHDLPEALTRDIISPVKHSSHGLKELIINLERIGMQEKIYDNLPDFIVKDIKRFSEDEFANNIIIDEKCIDSDVEKINKTYNRDDYSPRDGEIVKMSDKISAFVEASEAIKNGSTDREFHKARKSIEEEYREKSVAGIKIGKLLKNILGEDD